jgi:hypothetical protein
MVNGTKKGEYKTVKNLSFLRVFKAGHTVMSYREYCWNSVERNNEANSTIRTRHIVAGVHPNGETAIFVVNIDTK